MKIKYTIKTEQTRLYVARSIIVTIETGLINVKPILNLNSFGVLILK